MRGTSFGGIIGVEMIVVTFVWLMELAFFGGRLVVGLQT